MSGGLRNELKAEMTALFLSDDFNIELNFLAAEGQSIPDEIEGVVIHENEAYTIFGTSPYAIVDRASSTPEIPDTANNVLFVDSTQRIPKQNDILVWQAAEYVVVGVTNYDDAAYRVELQL